MENEQSFTEKIGSKVVKKLENRVSDFNRSDQTFTSFE